MSYSPNHPFSQLRLAAGIAAVVAWAVQIPWLFSMGMVAYGIAGGDNQHSAPGDIAGLLFINLPSCIALVLGIVSIRGSGKPLYKQFGGLGITLSCAWFIFLIGFMVFNIFKRQ